MEADELAANELAAKLAAKLAADKLEELNRKIIEIVSLAAASCNCRLMGVDFEKRTLNIDCPDHNDEECSFFIADVIETSGLGQHIGNQLNQFEEGKKVIRRVKEGTGWVI